MQKLLHEYFDNDGRKLSSTQLNEVHNFIRKNMVLTDTDEIFNFITYMASYAGTYERGKNIVTDRINSGKVIDKSSALFLTEKVIIKKAPELGPPNDLGLREIIKPERIYTLKFDKTGFQKKKFDEEDLTTKDEILKTIEKFDKVEAKAFNYQFPTL